MAARKRRQSRQYRREEDPMIGMAKSMNKTAIGVAGMGYTTMLTMGLGASMSDMMKH